MKKFYRIHLILAIIFLPCTCLLAQFDFKLEYAYDSLSVVRIQLPKSKKIRYIGREFTYDSAANIKDINLSKIRIYNEHHQLVKIVESKYPLEKSNQYIYTNRIFYHSESQDSKILFREMTKYPYEHRIIDEDGNVAERDSTVDFFIDSIGGLLPKAVKVIQAPSAKVYVQYYSYPDFQFEKEYLITGVAGNDYFTKIFRKKFDSFGDKLIISTDTAVFLYNNDHSLWKMIKPYTPIGYSFISGTLELTQKQINKEDDIELYYQTVKSSQYLGCYITDIKTILSTEGGQLIYESDYTQSVGPPERLCEGLPTRGVKFSLNGHKIVEQHIDNNSPKNNSLKVINIKDKKMVYSIPDSIGRFEYIDLEENNAFLVLIRKDSLIFFNDDDNFSLNFKTSDRLTYFISKNFLNKDSLIEWFNYKDGLVAKNQNNQIIFRCLKCNYPSLSRIKENDDKLIFSESVNSGHFRTLIYSKNIKTIVLEKKYLKQLKIYPNPANDIIKIDMTLDDYGGLEKCQLRVVDIVGKVHQTHPLSNFASIKEISVADLSNGLYFVQLVDKQGFLIANSKVVVVR
jgi:hypothetical protein